MLILFLESRSSSIPPAGSNTRQSPAQPKPAGGPWGRTEQTAPMPWHGTRWAVQQGLSTQPRCRSIFCSAQFSQVKFCNARFLWQIFFAMLGCNPGFSPGHCKALQAWAALSSPAGHPVSEPPGFWAVLRYLIHMQIRNTYLDNN